jgi:hypothetical protein
VTRKEKTLLGGEFYAYILGVATEFRLFGWQFWWFSRIEKSARACGALAVYARTVAKYV